MSFVAINVLEVPEAMASTLEQRFASRAGEVEKMDGFESFELLRPVAGSTQYLAYTRWESREAFETWVNSASFSRGHAQHASDGPAATGSQLWTFEVAQTASRERRG